MCLQIDYKLIESFVVKRKKMGQHIIDSGYGSLRFVTGVWEGCKTVALAVIEFFLMEIMTTIDQGPNCLNRVASSSTTCLDYWELQLYVYVE